MFFRQFILTLVQNGSHSNSPCLQEAKGKATQAEANINAEKFL